MTNLVWPVYRKLPYIWIFLALGLVCFFFAKAIGGYEQDSFRLIVFTDLIFSIGPFLIGVPAIALVLGESENKSSLVRIQSFSIIAQALGFFGALAFLFLSKAPGYFGFEQLPAEKAGLFLFSILFSLIGAGLFIVERFYSAGNKPISKRWPFLILFAGLGVAASLLLLLSIGLMGASSVYEASIPLADFLNQILIVAALSSVILSFSDRESVRLRNVVSVFMAAFGILLLMGFQGSSLRINQSSILWVVNQATLTLGFSGFTALVCFLLRKQWKTQRQRILRDGRWSAQLALVLSLVLLAIAQLGLGKLLLSSGMLDRLAFGIVLFALPLMFDKADSSRSRNQNFCISTFQVLSWNGLFVVSLSALVLSPFGAGLVSLSNVSFGSYFGFMAVGLFMTLLSLVALIWDKVLYEFI